MNDTLEMSFDAGRIPDADFLLACATLRSIIEAGEDELAAVSLAVLDSLEAEVDRRLVGQCGDRPITLRIGNFDLAPRAVQALMVAFISVRDRVLEQGKYEAGALFNAIVDGLGEFVIARKQQAAAETAELERMFALEDSRPN